MVLGRMVQGVVIFGFVAWYTVGVWKVMDDYFKEEYKKHLRNFRQTSPSVRLVKQSDRAGNRLKLTKEAATPYTKQRHLKERLLVTRNSCDRITLLHLIDQMTPPFSCSLHTEGKI